MRTCAVCGRPIYKADLCNKCYKTWGNGGNFPEWLKEMVKMQSSFERKKASDELPFCEFEEGFIEEIKK